MKRLILVGLLGCLVGACQSPSARLNAPPHGEAEAVSNLQDTYAFMVDNALLEDMTIGDAHFYPHRPMLNTLGEERLYRLMGLLEVYGGSIRFNSAVADKELLAARTAAIRTFLCEHGVDTTAETLVSDLPGGAGMDATQAIMIRAGEGRYKGKKKDSGGGDVGAILIGGGQKNDK